MADSNNKKYVLNGVGTAYLKVVKDGKTTMVKLGTMQDMKLSFNGSSEKIYGGDTLSPIYIINKDTSTTASFTEAQFGLEYLQLTNGADIKTGGTLIFNVEPTLIASGTTFTVPGSLTNIIPEETIAYLSDDAEGTVNVTYLEYVSSATGLTEGQFSITAAGVVTLGDTVTNKYLALNGLYTDTTSQSATVGTASIPGFVTIRHTSMPVEMSDGKKVILHTVIYKARSSGKLDIDQKRQAAATPQLEFEVFDSGRTDGVVVQITKQLV